MRFDILDSGSSWDETARLARAVADAGFSGMVFTEATSAPWMSLAVASRSAPELELATGISVAFARSPMVMASLAWEMAGNTGGRFRLGLGSQVKAHVERRFGAEFDPPGPRMRDYILAVRACLSAFRWEEPLNYEGEYYRLTLLPPAFTPPLHDFGHLKIDVSAVGPWMSTMAGEVADGIHVHPLHSVPYLRNRLLPQVSKGAERAGRRTDEIDLIIPVFAVPGDTREEQSNLLELARRQVAFYGTTRAYAFQFDDLGFEGVSAELAARLKSGDLDGMSAVITDEILQHFVVVASWDEMADALKGRYDGLASRLVMYLAGHSISTDGRALDRWGEVARAVTAADAK